MKKIVFLLLLQLFLFGCSQQISDNELNPIQENENENKQNEQSTKASVNPLIDFLPKNGASAYFEGEGNEFAEYSSKTIMIDETHFAQIEDNGAIQQLKIYRITNNAIELVAKEVVEDTPIIPSISKVRTYKKIETILQLPFKVGKTFENWTITSTTETLDLGWANFDNVIVIERLEDEVTTRKYFVKNYGLIKTEYEIKNKGEKPFIVTSTLKSLN